jgi:hypothetical protein
LARRAFVGALLVALLAAAPALADGDPASDYLISQRVFFPYSTTIPRTDQGRLTGIAEGAASKGFPIRVALISSPYDLGSVTVLWRKPRQYAKFLGYELGLVQVHGALLTVMPNGMGFSWGKRNVAPGQALVSGIPVPPGQDGLATAAITAVHRLAASYGVRVSATATPSGSHRNRNDRIVLIAAVVAALLFGGVARYLLKAQRPAS